MRLPLIVLLPGLAACGILDPGGNELDRQRGNWVELDRSSYSYVYRRSCFCPPPHNESVRIVVFEGRVASAVSTETGNAIEGTPLSFWPTIEDMFDFVAQAMDEDADELTVEYDPESFFPTSISIDWYRDAIDDEIGHFASGLIPVER
jgi:hypothetical protein